MDHLLNEIKGLMVSSQVALFGVAAAGRLDQAPSGQRPRDSLPGAQSAVCLGLPMPRGVLSPNGRECRNYWRAANMYYRELDMILLRLARLLEDRGQMALPAFG